MALFLERQKFRSGNRCFGFAHFRKLGAESEKLARLRIRQTFEVGAFDQTEQRGSRTDRESQGHDCHEGETGTFQQPAQRHFDLSQHRTIPILAGHS